jgi:putative oxidoreductase
MNIVLWILQILLALAFLAAGIPKAFQSIDTLAKRLSWTREVPAAFVRFIGIAEILGAIGLILPVLTHILPWLTIAAAIGLVLTMISAAVFHLARREYMRTVPSVVLLLLIAFVVFGRLALSPLL